jgi:uncharacterized protein
MTFTAHVLDVLPGTFAICRLPGDAPLPGWCDLLPFCSISRTQDELSIICGANVVPDTITADRGWIAFRVRGPFALTEVGVLARLAAPLATAGISIMAISTFDTDYILVKDDSLNRAISAFEAAGHEIRERRPHGATDISPSVSND